MNKLIAITIAAALAAVLAGCATKSRSFDAKGMYVSESGQLAIGYVHVDAIPEGVESAVIHYEEDVALLSPSTKTHDIDIILTGTNSVLSSEGVVKAICDAFVQVMPLAAKNGTASTTSPIDLAKHNADNAKDVKLAKAEAAKTQATSAECTDCVAGCTDANCKDCDPAAIAKGVCEECCTDGACDPK